MAVQDPTGAPSLNAAQSGAASSGAAPQIQTTDTVVISTSSVSSATFAWMRDNPHHTLALGGALSAVVGWWISSPYLLWAGVGFAVGPQLWQCYRGPVKRYQIYTKIIQVPIPALQNTDRLYPVEETKEKEARIQINLRL